MLKRLWNRWIFLGQDRATYLVYRGELMRRNLGVIVVASSIVAALMMVTAVLFHVVQGDLLRAAASLAEAALQASICVTAAWMLRRKRDFGVWPNILAGAMTLLMYLPAIYLGTVGAEGDLAVLIVVLFLLGQTVCDLPPLENVLMVLPSLALFLILSFRWKSAYNAFYDVIHASLSTVIGLALSYRKSCEAMAGIVAAEQLKKSNYALYHSSTTDELTGLRNRRQMFEQMEQTDAFCKEKGRLLACAVLDMDCFKAYNDHYGHPAGDRLLHAAGAAMTAFAAETGMNLYVGRIGGEEFLAVWPERNAVHAEKTAEALRRAVGTLHIEHAVSDAERYATMSAGLCVLPAGNGKKAYPMADRALYRAKDAGKNRLCVYCYADGTFSIHGRAGRGITPPGEHDKAR